jgi:plasmid maintenance system antidote protein VapI
MDKYAGRNARSEEIAIRVRRSFHTNATTWVYPLNTCTELRAVKNKATRVVVTSHIS